MSSKRIRILVAVAALALGALYFLPLWRVLLEAPQYPEGLGMRIWINTVSGIKPNDLDNINNLNHYIGMKRIVPESIPELRLMPVLVGILIALGVAAAAFGRRVLIRGWVGILVISCLVGLADFWKWEYEYGHDLDMENAIIKVPGMTYQPPLIGSRKLLNFTATSLPDSGGIIAMLAVGLAVVAVILDTREAASARRMPQRQVAQHAAAVA